MFKGFPCDSLFHVFFANLALLGSLSSQCHSLGFSWLVSARLEQDKPDRNTGIDVILYIPQMIDGVCVYLYVFIHYM